jgi:hypothetical protein
MVRRKGEMSSARLDREYSHQVLLRADRYTGRPTEQFRHSVSGSPLRRAGTRCSRMTHGTTYSVSQIQLMPRNSAPVLVANCLIRGGAGAASDGICRRHPSGDLVRWRLRKRSVDHHHAIDDHADHPQAVEPTVPKLHGQPAGMVRCAALATWEEKNGTGNSRAVDGIGDDHRLPCHALGQEPIVGNVALGAVMANVHDNLRSARERAVTAEEQAALDFALESFNRIGEAMVAGLTAGAAETDPNQHPVP